MDGQRLGRWSDDEGLSDFGEPGERGGELGGPGPAGVDSDPDLALAVDDPGGGVPAAGSAASSVRLVPGQRCRRVVWVQAIRSAAVNASCSQTALIANSRDGKRPIPVCLTALTRSSTWAWARCRASRNASWPVGGVGGHALVAPAVVGLHQADLGAGMGPFAADQDPHPLRPARRGETGQQPGQLRDRGDRQPCLVDRAGLSGRVDRGRPHRSRAAPRSRP